MDHGSKVAKAAALLGEPARANMPVRLISGRAIDHTMELADLDRMLAQA